MSFAVSAPVTNLETGEETTKDAWQVLPLSQIQEDLYLHEKPTWAVTRATGMIDTPFQSLPEAVSGTKTQKYGPVYVNVLKEKYFTASTNILLYLGTVHPTKTHSRSVPYAFLHTYF